MRGLARLLILEELTNSRERDRFIGHRRTLRGRPSEFRSGQWGRRRPRRYKNDLKDQTHEVMQGSDYDTGLHIPYGPKWDAKRIEKVVYMTVREV